MIGLWINAINANTYRDSGKTNLEEELWSNSQ